MQHQSSTAIEATVFDSAPPSVITPVVMGISGAMTVLAYVGSSWALFGVAFALLLAWDLRPRRGPKHAMLSCRAGAIRVPGRGLIRARDVRGATTARVGDRVALALAHRRRRRTPIIIDVADDAALAAVCKSLGIGHNGFGEIELVAQPTNFERLRAPLNALALLDIAFMFVPDTLPVAGALAFPLFAAFAFFTVLRIVTPTPTITLTSGGIFVPLPLRTFVPFHVIEEVRAEPDKLVLRLRTSEGVVVRSVPIKTSGSRAACTPAALAHLVAQMRDAVDRAHGKFAFKPEPTLASQLERAENEPLGDWRARIDTLGLGAAGYRATTIDAAELWTLLEDPEAKPDVRSAAARILARLDRNALRVRVADVLATVRDDDVRARIAESLEAEEDESLSARPLLK